MTNTSFLGGATDKSVVVRAVTVSTGLAKTDLAYNTSGLASSYWRAGANAAVAFTLATQTVSGAHSDGGFIHIANGLYRFDLPDAAIAAGADFVAFAFSGVADTFVTGCHIDILGVDPRGSTAVAANVTTWNGTAVGTPATAGYPVVTLKVGTGTGEVNLATGKAPATLTLAADVADAVRQAVAQEVLKTLGMGRGNKVVIDGSDIVTYDTDGTTEIARQPFTRLGATANPVNSVG